MTGRLARVLFLVACLAIAVLLLTGRLSPRAGGVAFAVALLLFGVLSRGFKAR